MPNGSIDTFAQVARVFATIFILIELILLLDFLYSMNDKLVDGEYTKLIAAIFFSILAAALAFMGE